jgi:hypothetical protein
MAAGGDGKPGANLLVDPAGGDENRPQGVAMPVQLNHTIVSAHDKQESATFMAEILASRRPPAWTPSAVQVDNDVSPTSR